jgi:hypothetical protein
MNPIVKGNGLHRTPPPSCSKRKLENVFDELNNSEKEKYSTPGDELLMAKKLNNSCCNQSDSENRKENSTFGK